MRLTAKQRAYVRGATRRWNIKCGATRSGKTWLDYAWTVPRRVRTAADTGLIALMGHTQETAVRNVIGPMRRIWGGDCVGPVRADGRIRLFGRDAVVLGAGDRDRVRAIQGAGFAYCYGDEVTTWHREVFEMLKSRLDGPQSRFDGTCNPAGPGHWFKTFLDSGADIFQQHYTIDDNPYLPKRFVADLKAEYAGSVRYDRYILGRWAKAEGRVFAGFGRACILDAPPGVVRRVAFGADIGHANATAFVAVGILDGDGQPGGATALAYTQARPWERALSWAGLAQASGREPKGGGLRGGGARLCVLREYYHSGRDGDTRSPLRYAQDFIRFREQVMTAWPDAADAGVYVDPSAKGFMAQLREVGYGKVYRGRNAVIEGIGTVGAMLDGGRLTVLTRCKNLIREMEGYVWDEAAAARGEDRVVKAEDHAVDALRYVAGSRRW